MCHRIPSPFHLARELLCLVGTGLATVVVAVGMGIVFGLFIR